MQVEIVYYHMVNGSRMPLGERKARWALLEVTTMTVPEELLMLRGLMSFAVFRVQ